MSTPVPQHHRAVTLCQQTDARAIGDRQGRGSELLPPVAGRVLIQRQTVKDPARDPLITVSNTTDPSHRKVSSAGSPPVQADRGFAGFSLRRHL